MTATARKGPMAPLPERPEIAQAIEEAQRREREERELLASLPEEERFWYGIAKVARMICTRRKQGENQEQCFRRYFTELYDAGVADWLLANPTLRLYLKLA